VYGPRQKAIAGGPVLPNLIEAVRQRRPFVDQSEASTDDFIYVEDAVAATLAAARAPRAAGRVVNVGSGQMTTIGDVVHILADLLRTSVVAGVSRSSDGKTRHITAETSCAAELLDFSPRVSLVAGLARLVRVLTEADQPEHPALAPVGLDD
jgi:nucleoside-diphosphate-sugar epimerase